jgi:hypothetical protein
MREDKFEVLTVITEHDVLRSNSAQFGSKSTFRANISSSRMASSRMLRRVALFRTDVLEELSVSIVRVIRSYA